jgi:hypothetical protein
MTKSARLELRLKPEHLELFRAAAGTAGISVSAWATERLLHAARGSIAVPLDPHKYIEPGLLTSAPMTQRTPLEELTPEERRASIASVPPEPDPIDPIHVELILEVLGRHCLDCASDEGHIVLVNPQGPSTPRNLQVLCDECAGDAEGRDYRDDAQQTKLVQPD